MGSPSAVVDSPRWFDDQLRTSADLFLWAVEQLGERAWTIPARARGLGTWSAARHAFHLVHYEHTIALPSMKQWLGGPRIAAEHLPHEDAAWDVGHELPVVMRDFRDVRIAQLSLLPDLVDEGLWDLKADAVWGLVSLRWVMTKTLQHTAEHAHDVLSLALFWQ